MGANPMVAQCAAHASFIVGTSSAFDHVQFPSSSFNSAHAAVKPWNNAFDQRKQRVKVDSIVTVEGIGVRKNGSTSPDALKFRCGYVDAQMLAFSWNDPVAPFKRSTVTRQSSKAKKTLKSSRRRGTPQAVPSKQTSARKKAKKH